MSTTREINPFVKSALEYGPVLIFFVAYLRFKDETFTLWGTDYSGFMYIRTFAAMITLLHELLSIVPSTTSIGHHQSQCNRAD